MMRIMMNSNSITEIVKRTHNDTQHQNSAHQKISPTDCDGVQLDNAQFMCLIRRGLLRVVSNCLSIWSLFRVRSRTLIPEIKDKISRYTFKVSKYFHIPTWYLYPYYHIENPDPDSKVHGANIRPICGRQDVGGPHVGPVDLAIWGTTKLKYTFETKLDIIAVSYHPTYHHGHTNVWYIYICLLERAYIIT